MISLGYRETVSLHQVRTFMLMESAQEQRQKELEKEQMRAAKLKMQEKAQELDRQRAVAVKAGAAAAGFGPSGGFGSNTVGAGGASGGAGGMGGSAAARSGGAGASGSMSASATPVGATGGAPAAAPARKAGKGMKLGSKLGGAGGRSGKSSLLESMVAEGELVDVPPTAVSGGAAPVAAAPTSGADVNVRIDEQVVVNLTRDGSVDKVEVKGDLTLVVANPATARIQAVLDSGENPGVQFKTHPNINKAKFADEAVLQLKDATRAFPLSTDLAVLKWRMQSTDDSRVPIMVTCWPSPSNGSCLINIEYELTMGHLSLQDVVIAIPLPSAEVKVEQVDGAWEIDQRRGALLWKIMTVDKSNASGSLEFSVPGENENAFFPVTVSFVSATPYCDVKIASIQSVEDGAPINFHLATSMTVDEYTVG